MSFLVYKKNNSLSFFKEQDRGNPSHFLLFLFLTIFLFLSPKKCFALQNVFGLHLTQPSDIHSASKIINSSGGDWGYVTIVVPLNRLDHNTWQEFFNNCRRYHIIPIVRLATYLDGDSWKRPSVPDIDTLANFLNSLNWPATPQYVILFNEINHGLEWGGEVDIKSYADISIYAYQKFKSLNSNFFILSGGLDLAAPEIPPKYKSAANVYKEIKQYNSDFFNSFDGLANHYYPQNQSSRDYKWELNLLSSLGISKNYPVFITETASPGPYNASFIKSILQNWQKDSRVIAITPFIYNYPNYPFENFSWVDKQEQLLPQYQKIVDLPKTKNTPAQITKYEFVKINLPFLILANTDYSQEIVLKNTGQSIWGETSFCIKPASSSNLTVDALCTSGEKTEPGRTQTLNFKFKISTDSTTPQKAYISWENLPQFEIVSFSPNSTIYRPKTGIFNKITTFFKGLTSF